MPRRVTFSSALPWLGLVIVLVSSLSQSPAKELIQQTEANVVTEITFTAAQEYADPFNEVTLDVVFSEPGGRELRVPAFWAGGNLWRVRYASPLLGAHRFHTVCSDVKDHGLHNLKGKVQIKAYHGTNPLYAHGPLKVASDWRHLEHADGTPFFWLGDTWWMGLCNRLHWPEEFQRLTADRKQKGFNVIQIVAGLYPDMHPFDPRGANETGYPWKTNYTTIRPEFFNAADDRLKYLLDQGMLPCIFGAWGHYIAGMGVEKAKQHWRYLIARYGAWPVVWSAAGEANLPWYLVKNFPYDDRKQARDWSDVMRYIRATDPYHRLLTVHPTGIHRFSSRTVTDDPALLDFDMLQTPHGFRDAVPETIKNVRQSYEDTPLMPVIDGEASYEMLTVPTGQIPTEWPRRMFWLCMMNGAAGHTYGANGIWQCNRAGQPHGPSPTAGSTGYGSVSWDEAMNFPGSRQIGLGKRFLEGFKWYNFQPHPEWAEFVAKSSLTFDGDNWIWFPEGDPAKDAPIEKRYFRRAFELPAGKAIEKAQLRVSADDSFSASLNGQPLGTGNNFKFGKQFSELARLLKPGTNLLAITAENLGTAKPNPAGLIARLEITFAEGGTFKLDTDSSWHSANKEISGWDSMGFEDSTWTNSIAIGRYGENPWQKIDALNNDGVFGPQSLGLTNGTRIIYVPESDPVRLRNLNAQTEYSVSCFDPVTGGTSPGQPIRPDNQGSFVFPPPTGQDHDWVIVLEPGAAISKPTRQATASRN